MSKVFDGVQHLTCSEMAERFGESAQSWRRQARLARVPAINYRNVWYFDPDRVRAIAIKDNGFNTGDNLNNATQRGAEVDLSDFE